MTARIIATAPPSSDALAPLPLERRRTPHPAQQQTRVVQDLGVDLNEGGFVVVEKDYGSPDGPQQVMETSRAGVFAAGDLTSPAQSAVLATFEGALAGQMMLLSLLGV